MDGYPPGAPLVEFAIEEFATVKSAPPSVVMHSGALDPHSLFWIVYVPPPADAVCELHSVLVAACELAGSTQAPAAARATAAARASACLGGVMHTSKWLDPRPHHGRFDAGAPGVPAAPPIPPRHSAPFGNRDCKFQGIFDS